MESSQTPEHASFLGRGLQASPASSSSNSESSASSSTGGCPIPLETPSATTNIPVEQAQDDQEPDLTSLRKRLNALHEGYEADIARLVDQNKRLQTIMDRKQRHDEKTLELEDQLHKLDKACWELSKRQTDGINSEVLTLRERLRERSTQYYRLKMEHDNFVSKAEATERGLEATCEEQTVEIERLRAEREYLRGQVIWMRWVLGVISVWTMVLAILRHWWRIASA